jgi:sarcosine oxidase subunit gamma
MSEFVEEGEVNGRRESPLHYVAAEDASHSGADAGIIIHEQAYMGHLNLRGNPEDEIFRNGVTEVLGIDLPIEPGRFSGSNESRLYWLGPNEWLAIVAGGTEAEAEARLRQTLSGHFSVVDVSGGQTLVNLSGEAVDRVLKKSSVYDFHSSQFTPGRCVQTRFAKASALISKNVDHSFDLVIRRSFSDYLFRWIVDAASEYGIEVKGGHAHTTGDFTSRSMTRE